MIKRIAHAFVAIALFFTFSPITFAHEYQDVPRESAYFYPIDYLRRNDVFLDTRYFYPNLIISKAEFIKYLVLLNSPNFVRSSKVELPFDDTDNHAWYAPYFKEAIKLGILDSRDRYVKPYNKLTVADALTLLFHSQSIPIPHVYKGNIPFTDISPNSINAALFMRAISLDIAKPARVDYFGIYRRVTRAEAARMIYKMDLATIGLNNQNALPQAINSTTENLPPELQKIVSVWMQIESSFLYQKDFDKTNISDAALKAMVDALGDKYSAYMDKGENKNFSDSIDGNLEGIGAVLGQSQEEEIVIIRTIKDAPAQNTGLLANDVILEVDGQSMAGKQVEEAVSLIKGPSGTTVNLKIRRNGVMMDFAIQRAAIIVNSVELQELENGSLYHISLSQFGTDSDEELAEVFSAFKNDPEAKGIILDLRNNPGGLLDVSVNILGHFIEAQKEVVTINYKDYSQVLLSRGDGEMKGLPMVILINDSSASASEIVAGAMKDYGLATLVGETTFGKGTVQSLKILPDQSSLKLTVAQWLTPGGYSINEEGVDPNISVADDKTTVVDEQLEAGITEVKKLIQK